MRKAPTIRELDQRKREREKPDLTAADAFFAIFGMTREQQPEPAHDVFGDWT